MAKTPKTGNAASKLPKQKVANVKQKNKLQAATERAKRSKGMG